MVILKSSTKYDGYILTKFYGYYKNHQPTFGIILTKPSILIPGLLFLGGCWLMI